MHVAMFCQSLIYRFDEIKLVSQCRDKPTDTNCAGQNPIMAVSARASTFAVGTPIRPHTVARTQARRASRLETNSQAIYTHELF